MVAGTSTVSVGRSSRERRKRRIGCEARMDGHGRAELQRRRGLDVEPADMEERQHGEDVIVAVQSCMCWLMTAFHTSASWRSTAPFGRPVVPEV